MKLGDLWRPRGKSLSRKVGMWRRDRSAWVQTEVQSHVTWAREGKDVAPDNGKSNYAQVFPGRRLRQFAGDSITAVQASSANRCALAAITSRFPTTKRASADDDSAKAAGCGSTPPVLTEFPILAVGIFA